MINMVDVKVAETPAARPQEAVEALNLPEQFRRFARPFFRERRSHRSMHPVAAQQNEIADFAVLDALIQFLERAAVPGHQSHPCFQVLRRRLVGELEHPAGSRTIRRKRLLHKHVQPLLDCVSKMHPTKRQRRGKDRDVAGLQAVHRLLVSVEADEFAVFRHFDQFAKLLAALKRVITALEPVLEDVRHGDEFDRAVFDGESVTHGAGTATAAADQRDLDGVVLRSVDVGKGHASQGRYRG